MSFSPKPLSNQVVVVTGASSGIGLVTARLFASHGARVMLVARSGAELARIAARIRSDGGVADHAVADVGEAAELERAAECAIERWGRIDTWVNNAGVAIYAKLLDTPADEHERLFRTNYWGVVNGSLTAVRHMRERGGSLITMGSIVADVPAPILSAYTASKQAVRAYTEALRMELANDGVPVEVSLIKPAGVATPLAEHATIHADGAPLIPQPAYDPAVVARAVVNAAQDRGRTITVGGFGRATVLAKRALPALSELVSRGAGAMLIDPTSPPPRASNLFAGFDAGRERSGRQSGRSVSLYTEAVQHRGLALAGLGALAAVALAAGLAARRR